MKRFASLLLACLMALTSTALAVDMDDYNQADKLYLQLLHGSGFSGTLTLEASTPDGTLEPLTLRVDYIYVLPTQTQTDEHRLDLTLVEDGADVTAAHAQWKDGALSVAADALGTDWYSLGADDLGSALSGPASRLGAPGLAQAALECLIGWGGGNETLTAALDLYLTHMDLWIEGFRQEAELGKDENGVSTMTTSYSVPASAVKAQAKRLIMDVLSDSQTLSALQAAVGEDASTLMLNPNLQSFYFEAIDALPLEDDLTVRRVVSLEGETLELDVHLPLYDAQGGAVSVTYNRYSGGGDMPDTNAIVLDAGETGLELEYSAYTSMTGVRVYQGSLLSRAEDRQTISTDFSLTCEESEGQDDDGLLTYDCNAVLTLTPGKGEGVLTFPETELSLTSHFASGIVTNAPTSVTASLSLSSGETQARLDFEGASRAKWTPEEVPADKAPLSDETATLALGLIAAYWITGR